jgi:hypothetical protein
MRPSRTAKSGIVQDAFSFAQKLKDRRILQDKNPDRLWLPGHSSHA